MICAKCFGRTEEDMADSSPGNGGKSSQGNLLLKKQGKLIMYEKVQHVCEWDQLYFLSV